MAITTPPTFTAVPALPEKSDVGTFRPRWMAWLQYIKNNVPTEWSAAMDNVFANATDAQKNALGARSSAGAAQASATAAQASNVASYTNAANAATSAGAVLWVSGQSYTLGARVIDPPTSKVFRRAVAGAGTVAPSRDATNWASVATGMQTVETRALATVGFSNVHYELKGRGVRKNMLLHSNNFTNSVWGNGGLSIAVTPMAKRSDYLNSDPYCKNASAWSTSDGNAGASISTATINDGVVGSSALVVTGSQSVNANSISCEAGQVLRLETYARKVFGTGLFYLRIFITDAAGTVLGYYIANEKLTLTNGFVKYFGSLTVPLGGVWATPYVVCNWAGDGVTQLQGFYLEDVTEDVNNPAPAEEKIYENTVTVVTPSTNGSTYCYQTFLISGAVAQPYAFSIDLRNINFTGNLTMYLLDQSGWIGAASALMEPLNNELTRYTVSGVFGANSATYMQVIIILIGGVAGQKFAVANAQLEAGLTSTAHMLSKDTSGTGGSCVVLPANPSPSDEVVVASANGRTNNDIARNNHTIDGIADDLRLDTSNAATTLRYTGSTWRVTK